MIMSGLFLFSCRVTHSMKSSSDPEDRSSTQLTSRTVNVWNGVGTGTPFQRKQLETGSLGTKQTQVKPNANRVCPLKLVNHIQP